MRGVRLFVIQEGVQLLLRLGKPRRLSNDFLLPTMITFLNDRDWQTRAAFFREVPCMAAQAGFAGMEAFLLPCVEQASPLLTRLSHLSYEMG